MNKIKDFMKLSNEDIIMIVLALLSFSFGIWTNYRQLWLHSIGFGAASIGKLLSVGLLCSAVIVFIISFFSTKVKLKNVMLFSILLRAVSLFLLVITSNTFIIKFSILINVMCDAIFSLTIYPLISTINKSNETYQKHLLINYVCKDTALVFCGLLLGVTVGKMVFDYNTCLFLALMFTLASAIVLLLLEENKDYKKRNILPLKKAFKNLFKSKVNNYYLFAQLLLEISYGMIFGLMMLILTTYIGMDVSFSAVFIIVCNMFGSIICSIFNKIDEKMSINLSVIIKYGTKVLFLILAFIFKNNILYVIAIVIAYISVRILNDKVNGTYIRKIETNSQFLFGNINYFVICIGESIGVLIAGIVLAKSLAYVFLYAALFIILGMMVYFYMNRKK